MRHPTCQRLCGLPTQQLRPHAVSFLPEAPSAHYTPAENARSTLPASNSCLAMHQLRLHAVSFLPTASWPPYTPA